MTAMHCKYQIDLPLYIPCVVCEGGRLLVSWPVTHPISPDCGTDAGRRNPKLCPSINSSTSAPSQQMSPFSIPRPRLHVSGLLEFLANLLPLKSYSSFRIAYKLPWGRAKYLVLGYNPKFFPGQWDPKRHFIDWDHVGHQPSKSVKWFGLWMLGRNGKVTIPYN